METTIPSGIDVIQNGSTSLEIRIPTNSNATSFEYTMFVRSGREVHIVWAITLSIIGGITIAIILTVGCFVYFFKKRKRSIYSNYDSSFNSIQE